MLCYKMMLFVEIVFVQSKNLPVFLRVLYVNHVTCVTIYVNYVTIYANHVVIYIKA